MDVTSLCSGCLPRPHVNMPRGVPFVQSIFGAKGAYGQATCHMPVSALACLHALAGELARRMSVRRSCVSPLACCRPHLVGTLALSLFAGKGAIAPLLLSAQIVASCCSCSYRTISTNRHLQLCLGRAALPNLSPSPSLASHTWGRRVRYCCSQLSSHD